MYQKEQRIKKLEAKLKAAGISYESKGDFQGLEEEDELEQEAEDGEDEEKVSGIIRMRQRITHDTSRATCGI